MEIMMLMRFIKKIFRKKNLWIIMYFQNTIQF